MTSKKYYIAYYRCSTKGQAASGLGLEAQQKAVEDLVHSRNGELLESYTEIESGRVKERPQLAAAIARARRQKATLAVARLDRLSRSVSFLAQLAESNLDIICCDIPQMDRFLLHVLAALAEKERELISIRTKDALAAAKARGTALGSARKGHWVGKEHIRLSALKKARTLAAKKKRDEAVTAYVDIAPRLQQLLDEGLSARAMARNLNAEKVPPRRGDQWSGTQVIRVIRRLGLSAEVALSIPA